MFPICPVVVSNKAREVGNRGLVNTSFFWCFLEASLEPFLVTKSVRLNRTELLFFSRVANREI